MHFIESTQTFATEEELEIDEVILKYVVCVQPRDS